MSNYVQWNKKDPRHAFVSGAAWWEFTKTGATIWPSDRTCAEEEAEKRYGKYKTIPNELKDKVEQVMTKHWDMKACDCLICQQGRYIGFSPKDKYLPHKTNKKDASK